MRKPKSFKALSTSLVGLLAVTSLAACGESAGGSASADAITVGTLQPVSSTVYSNENPKHGMEAAIEALNADGGLAGKELQLDFCDTAFEANKELSCTRDLIKKEVSAVLTPMIMVSQSGREYKLAEQAGMPFIGGRGLVLADLSSEASFPLTAGQQGWAYATIENLRAKGAKNIAIFADDNAASHFTAKLQTDALASAGMKPKHTVFADPKADPTYTSSAAKATAGDVDGVVMSIAPANYPKAVQALRKGGYDGLIAHGSTLSTPENLKALGSTADGILTSAHFASADDTSNAEIKRFREEMKKYRPKAQVDESTLAGWAAVQLFAEVMRDEDDFDSESVLKTFNELSEPVDIGVIPPYKVKGQTPPLKETPRMFNPYVQNSTIKDEGYEADGDFVNPFESLQSN